MLLTSDGLPIRDLYVDESSQTQARYLVLGCITLPASDSAQLAAFIAAQRLPELPASELKWTKVSRSKLDAYKRVADAFFAAPWAAAHFHSVVVDTHHQDHRRFNDGSREIGFSKEIYQLVQKVRRLYGGCALHVYPDRREAPLPTSELRTILNHGARKAGDPRAWPFRRVHFQDSLGSQIIQLTDIFAGAIAFRVNGRHAVPGASASKIELADHIMRAAGLREVARDTRVSGKFTIWHRVLRK